MSFPAADRVATLFPLPRSVQLSTIRAALFLLCCFAIGQCGGQTAQPDDHSQKISGTVLNSVTQAPIPRVLVYSNDNHLAMMTDAEGRFEFTLPKGESHPGENSFAPVGRWLRARKRGFLEDPSPRRTDQPADGDLIIRLIPEDLIKGKVIVSDSEGLSGMTVQLFLREVIEGVPRWQPGPIVRTNSAGEFRFAELRAGEYKVVTHELRDDDPLTRVAGEEYGYPPVYYPGAPDFASAATITLAPGQAVDADLSPVRQRYYSVKIPVTNEGLSGINVAVLAHQGPGYSLGFNPGTRQIEGFLPNGSYVIQGDVYGPDSLSGAVNLRVNAAAVEGSPMTLIPNNPIRVEVKEEFTDTTWSGSMSWSDGKKTFSVRGPRMYLQPRVESADDFQSMRGGSLRPPSGPNDESLILDSLPPGRYWLRLNTSRGYVASAHMGSLDLLQRPFVITPGASARIEIELRDDGGQIEGTVSGLADRSANTGETPETTPWVYCVPLPDSPGQFQQNTTSEDRRFSYSMLAPGSYRILAFARRQPQLPYRDADAMRAFETKGIVVHVAAGQKANVQVPLIPDIND